MSKLKNFKAMQSFGIGLAPSKAMPAPLLSDLYRQWRSKLAESGFQDIEMHDYKQPGKVLPVFRYGGAAQDLSHKINSSTLEYYSQCSAFSHDMNWRVFKHEAALLRYIWLCYSNGASIRVTAKALAGLPVRYPHNLYITKPHHTFKQRRGIWWVHKQLHRILPHFKTWQANQRFNEED